MKVLFVISQLPYPPDTGAKIRTFNLLKRVASDYEITLISFGREEKEKEKIEALRKFCKRIILISEKKSKWTSFLCSIAGRLPYSIRRYYSSKMERLIKKLINSENFDLIHCDSLQMSFNLRSVNSIPKVLTEHNVESQIWQRWASEEKNFLKRYFIKGQYKKISCYEFEILKMFDCCIAVSEEDKKIIEENSQIKKVWVVPNGVDCDYFDPDKMKSLHLLEKEFSLIFTGSLDWYPNQDALIYFFTEIYPLLKKRIPQISINIVGRNPSKSILKFARRDNSINIVGRVEDIRPFIFASQIFVVPLRIGGGTRLKILEAMAMAKPVISTSVGAEGLGVTHEENIILADNPYEFASKILRLFEDKNLREKIGKNARQFVKEKYDWNIVAEKLVKVWKEMIII